MEKELHSHLVSRLPDTTRRGEETMSIFQDSYQESQWPEPTVEEPDLETLEEWLWEDGGCETTDGCFCEPDGTCQHGYPSCAPRSVPTQSSREEPKNGVS
jgi:hypothetical protein